MGDRKSVTVFTGTRAEYGLLYWVLKELESCDRIILNSIVSGTHLSPEYGETYKYIEGDGFSNIHKVEMLLSSSTPIGTCKSFGLAILGYSEVLNSIKPDIVIVLGDRYEALAMAQSAFLLHIPILHLHGGEVTEGANDDSIRHAITKLSNIHCASTNEYKDRIIQMGEQPCNVYNVGALGLDHLFRSELPTRDQLQLLFDFDFRDKYISLAYHSVTNDLKKGEKEFDVVISALQKFPGYNLVVSYPNADTGSQVIKDKLELLKDSHGDRVLIKESYGHLNFLAITKYADLVVGNSSSGIIEAPSLKTPSLNVGERQKGRVSAGSVYGIENPTVDMVIKTVERIVSTPRSEHDYENPYYKSDVSGMILNIILNSEIGESKRFFDIKRCSESL